MHKSYITISIFVILLFSFCKSTEEVTTLGNKSQQFEGWAGPPEDLKAKPQEYFYMKTAGRASEKAIDKRSGAMIQTTCTDAAQTNAKGDLIGKLIGESITGAPSTGDGQSLGKVVVREFQGKL